jgi:hypothetical protein
VYRYVSIDILVYHLRYNCVLFNVMHNAVDVFGKGCSLLSIIVVMRCSVESLEA